MSQREPLPPSLHADTARPASATPPWMEAARHRLLSLAVASAGYRTALHRAKKGADMMVTRLFGVDPNTACIVPIVTGVPILANEVDTVFLAFDDQPDTSLKDILAPLGVALHFASDWLAPRLADEAVYEGMVAGLAV